MIDIKKLVGVDEEYIKGIIKKGSSIEILKKTAEAYTKSIIMTQQIDERRARQNYLAKIIPTISSKEEKSAMLEEMKILKDFLKKNEPIEKELKEEIKKLICSFPNPAHKSVIIGKDDSQNKVLRKVGEKKNYNFTPKPHWELGEDLDLIDSLRGSKVSGARFHFLKNELVSLQFALIQYVFEILDKYGFQKVLPPQLVSKEVAFGTGYLESGHESEIYIVNPGDDDLFLIGTSEVPNTAYYMDEIIEEKDLPIRFGAYSTCFRKEAGSSGKDTRGILRCHQFDKLEMGVFSVPEKSYEEHELLLKIEEEIYSGLGIHFQVIDICSGDLGGPAAKKYDLEAWMPGQDAYREITSTSNCTDFQARRLNIRVKREDKNEILHTLNGTAIAVGRTLIAIMEQYQTENGEIMIPEKLRKWTGFDKISKKNKDINLKNYTIKIK